MKKYTTYKPSGIEWLEGVPEHWEISKLKYLGELYGGLTGKSGVDFNNDENPKNKPYIPYTNILNNTYISKDHFHYVSIDEGENQNLVLKNDLFFLMSSETYKDLGKSCILIEDVDELYLNSFCKGYRIKNDNIFPLFLNYQIIGHLHRELISTEGKGFTRINLRQDKINDLVVFYPPLSEQHQIVRFLDEKTEIIDKLISTKQRKIDLLNEQRTSLINQVIIKGLNPNVKLKDSGVDWIGEIPEHWEMRRVSNFGVFFKGSGIKEDEVKEEGIPCIRYGEIYTKYNRVVYEPVSFIDEGTSQNSVKIKKGDVLFTGSGETMEDIGKSVVYFGEQDIFVGGDIIVLRLNNGLNPLFISYLMNTNFVQYQKSLSGRGEIIVHIYSKNIKEIVIPLPPISEQNQIVKHLDDHIQQIEHLIFMEQKKIDLLKEYRQSLISEVITGKIDVRTNLN